MTVALVTGANQGIGLAVVEELIRVLGRDAAIYLTGRDAGRVEKAAAGVPGALPAVMDVGVTESIEEFAGLVRDRHGGVDIVISNAAARISPDRRNAEQIQEFVNTNNLGTTRMIRAFGPLLRPAGRFLIVASALGSLRNVPRHLWHLFDTAEMTVDDIDKVMLDYAGLVRTGRDTGMGWPNWINVASKVGQVAAARIFARDGAAADGAYIGAVCPGLVDTPASRPWFPDMSSAQTPQEAAKHVVHLVAGDTEPGFAGRLVQHGRVIPWT